MNAQRESLQQIANRHVPFPLAARWAGIIFGGDPAERGSSKTHCPFEFNHLDAGAEKAFRVYSDHGFCFAERKRFSVVTLLATYWDMPREDAALKALNDIGWRPVSYAHLFEEAQKPPEPDRTALAAALAEWCRANCPDWLTRQYREDVAARLSACLALLPLVKTGDDCRRWLQGCQRAMLSHLTLVK